jgi:hypothetical protein
MRRSWLAGSLLAALALGGCGGSSGHGQAAKQLTVPAYGGYAATTESVSGASPGACRRDAGAFTRDALLFLAHSGPEAAYPADLYYISMRGVLVDFQGHRCDSALLGGALSRRLTTKQRDALVAGLPHAMARVVREGLAHTRA